MKARAAVMALALGGCCSGAPAPTAAPPPTALDAFPTDITSAAPFLPPDDARDLQWLLDHRDDVEVPLYEAATHGATNAQDALVSESAFHHALAMTNIDVEIAAMQRRLDAHEIPARFEEDFRASIVWAQDERCMIEHEQAIVDRFGRRARREESVLEWIERTDPDTSSVPYSEACEPIVSRDVVSLVSPITIGWGWAASIVACPSRPDTLDFDPRIAMCCTPDRITETIAHHRHLGPRTPDDHVCF